MDRRVNLLSLAWGINVLAFSIIYPFLPIYLHKIRGFPMVYVGLLFPVMAAGRLAASAFSGSLVDKMGRRKALVWAPAARSAAFLVLAGIVACDGSLLSIAVFLFLSVFAGAFISSATDAYVVDITSHEERTGAFSRLRVGLNVGFMIGPAIGAFMSRTPFSLIFLVTAALCLLTSLMAHFGCPETCARRDDEEASGCSVWTPLKEDKRLRRFLICLFLLFCLSSQLVSTLSIYVVGIPGQDQNGLGFLYTVNGLLVILFQIPLNRILGSDGLGRRLAYGCLLYLLGYFSLGFCLEWSQLALAVVILTCGEMLTEPAAASVLSRLAPRGRVGVYMSYSTLMQGLGGAVGPFVGALAYEKMNGSPVMLWGLLASTAILAGLGFHMARRSPEMR